MRALLRRHWPPEGQVRLLTAALTDSDTARTAWRKWRDENDLALADHAEVRLLAAVAGRIRKIEADTPLDPRLEGMRRHIWAMNQMALSVTKPLLAAMSAAGLPLMLMKGAARLATDPGLSKERALRDVDVLIHPDHWERAVDVALAAGWRNSRGGNDELLQSTSHAIGLSGPNSRAGDELDLHRFAIRQNQGRGHDLGLWQRAQRAAFNGVEVLCPTPTDQAIISLSQASLYNRHPHPAHWALDVGAFLQADQVDWDLFLREAHFRRIELFLAAPLLLLRERLQCAVPEEVLADLTRPVGAAYRLEFETRATRYQPRTQEAFEAFRIVAAARAMRLARALELPQPRQPALPDSTIRIGRIDRDTSADIPLPANLSPFARVRLDISFKAWTAGRHSHLRVMSRDVLLALISVPRANRKHGGRVRYEAVLRVPACLISLSGADTIQIRASRKLRARAVRIRFGAPLEESGFAGCVEAMKDWLSVWLPGSREPLRRPAAKRASL